MNMITAAKHLLLSILLSTGLYTDTNYPNLDVYYKAVIDDPSLNWMYYKVESDYKITLEDWNDFDIVLDSIKESAKGKPILLSLMVHGGDSGLFFQWEENYSNTRHSDRASFGYVIKQIKKHLGSQVKLVVVESCYSGRAYKNTIRNNVVMSLADNIDDYESIPDIPIYGIGSASSNCGPLVYLQLRDKFRIPNCFQDLRDYDNLQKKPRELDPYEDSDIKSPTLDKLKEIWKKYTPFP